jgi:hypothetical protein
MSRTKKGRKKPHTELWSKRASKAGVVGHYPGPFAKSVTHRMERIEAKQVVEEQKKEMGEDDRATYHHVISDEC